MGAALPTEPWVLLIGTADRAPDDGPVFPGLEGRSVRSTGCAARKPCFARANADVTRFMASAHPFRDWAGDRTTFAREVVEAALAHAVGTRPRPPTGAATRWRSAAS